MTAAALLSSGGKFNILQKSEPVPRGIIPSVASFEINRSFSKKPFTTSLIVPSPPTAMMVVAPLLIAFAVSSMPCPGALVSSVSIVPGNCVRTLAHVSFVRPRADSGLRIATVLAIVAGILLMFKPSRRYLAAARRPADHRPVDLLAYSRHHSRLR